MQAAALHARCHTRMGMSATLYIGGLIARNHRRRLAAWLPAAAAIAAVAGPACWMSAACAATWRAAALDCSG